MGSPATRSNRPRATTIGHGPAGGDEADAPLLAVAHHAVGRSQPEGRAAGQHEGVEAGHQARRVEQGELAGGRGAAPHLARRHRPSGNSTTVQPVAAAGSVQWPTRSPATSVITGSCRRHPRADGAHDLVGDRAQPGGPLVGGDALVALVAQQDDLVAGAHGGVGAAVDHELVHGDDADHRPALAADQHLLRRPAAASGTRRRRSPMRHGGDRRLPTVCWRRP